MVTYAVDDRLIIAQKVAEMMSEIDPGGSHFAGDDPMALLGTFEDEKPDIVWLDIEMPGMNGLVMAAKIKQVSPDTNIVFVTGFPEYAVDAFGMHVSGFIVKPVTKEKLRDEKNNLRRPIPGREEKRSECNALVTSRSLQTAAS